MGFAIPASIAAKLACPDRQVVCIVGDGGLLMNGFEILSAHRISNPPTIIVFNDGALGSIEQAQMKAYKRSICTQLKVPSFDLLAAAMGMDYSLILNDKEITPVLKDCLTRSNPTLVDVRVCYTEQSRYFRGAARGAFGALSLEAKRDLCLRYAHRWLRSVFN